MDSPRSALARISPSTQRTASMMLDLPQPLGPTTPTRLPGVTTVVGSTKVLNPASLSLASRTFSAAGAGSGMARHDTIAGLFRPSDIPFRNAAAIAVNPNLDRLHPYPFEKLRELLEGAKPPAGLAPIRLSIGEPRHATPAFIKQALADNLDGLATYPTTQGTDGLRGAIAAWMGRRYGLNNIDAATQVLPVTGTREALFAFAQCVIDASRPGARVLAPNPFYQIYEGAALLAGAEAVFMNNRPENGFASDFADLPETVWRDVQLVYVCSPGNPTGRVMTVAEWA